MANHLPQKQWNKKLSWTNNNFCFTDNDNNNGVDRCLNTELNYHNNSNKGTAPLGDAFDL